MILGTMNLVTVHEKLELEAREETAGNCGGSEDF
jgi:hypothetical protein